MQTENEDVKEEAYGPVANKVNVGDVMAIVTYIKVNDVQKNGEFLKVSNVDSGAAQAFEIYGKDIVENSFSADQFVTERKVTKTRLAEILVNSHNRPFTVTFSKEDGSTRVLRGRLVHPEPLLGRSKVEDLDIADRKSRLRLVDHRTIDSLIVNGIKYSNRSSK